MSLSIERVDGHAALPRLTRRGAQPQPDLPPVIAEQNARIFGEPLSAQEVVERVISDVRTQGDTAVRHYTRLFDDRELSEFEVPSSEWTAALDRLPVDLRSALTLAAERIESFHTKQVRQSWFDAEQLGVFGQIVRPLARVGIYTPSGSAALPSSTLMTAIPARVAGVEEIVVAAPPRGDDGIADAILAACAIARVDRVFAIGGAQAIAAMAFGTETVPQVDKICGPGGLFVALAKQAVSGTVAIDQIAGPTETLVVADDTADLELVAADLIAQAEHDPLASAILVTTSSRIADAVPAELERQITDLPRAEIVRQSLNARSVIARVDSIEEAMECANAYAPEHMCLLVERPWELVPLVRNAGGVFVGETSPEALGDYTAGPSHVMPTGGTARFSSPTNVGDYVKVISLAAANAGALDRLGSATMRIARAEGLEGHARSIERRLVRHHR